MKFIDKLIETKNSRIKVDQLLNIRLDLLDSEIASKTKLKETMITELNKLTGSRGFINYYLKQVIMSIAIQALASIAVIYAISELIAAHSYFVVLLGGLFIAVEFTLTEYFKAEIRNHNLMVSNLRKEVDNLEKELIILFEKRAKVSNIKKENDDVIKASDSMLRKFESIDKLIDKTKELFNVKKYIKKK